MNDNEKTVGELKMGITFIPGNNDKAQNIKEKCAKVINTLDSLRSFHESDGEVSKEKLEAIESAQNDIVEAGLKAALAVTMA